MQQINIERLLEIAVGAGRVIMSFYDKQASVTIKADNSPVTDADLAANDYIVARLPELGQHIQIVSEENCPAYETIDVTKPFWLVDPLDGTKGYINKSGEFTVNIGLIVNQHPVIGVIYLPVKDQLYYTDGHLAYKLEPNCAPEVIKVRDYPGHPIIASNRLKAGSNTMNYIDSLLYSGLITISSSIKFCLLAGGQADIYPRFGTTMEWDTAAGHAILQAAGGRVVDMEGLELTYGKPGFINGDFIASK